jgi:serine/threonine protein kinase
MTRSSNFNDQFSSCISNSFSLNQPGCFEGYLYLIAFLNGSIDCGYESPPEIMFKSMNINYLEYLSSGLTSSVYKGEFMDKKTDRSFVIKQFNNKDYFDQELKIMNLISKSKNKNAKKFVINLIGEAIFKLDKQSTNCMLLSPFCEQADRGNLTEIKLNEYFDCLKAISQFEIVHRDISNRHFMRNSKTKRLIIIDFGFAHKCGEYTSFSGSTTFAPNIILSGAKGHFYKPNFMHDLESLVKMIFTNSFYSEFSPILSKINHDFGKLFDFWYQIEESFSQKGDLIMAELFKSIKSDIENEKYEFHCDKVKDLFKKTSLCCVDLNDYYVKLFKNLNLDSNVTTEQQCD